MHESIVALGIVREIDKYIKKNGYPKRIKIILGELQNIDEEILSEYIKIYFEEQGITNIEYSLMKSTANFRCSSCKHEWNLNDVALTDAEREYIHFLPEAIYTIIKCPKCSSRLFEIVEGRGITIKFEDD